MKKMLIVKNIKREGPGLLEGVLKANTIAFDLVDLDAGQDFPPPQSYQALVVLGGPDSANDTTGKMIAELHHVRIAIEQGIPYLGICLGLQVAVKAAGGSVIPGVVKEIGLLDPNNKPYTVQVTNEGTSDPLLQDLDATLRVFQLHGETVEITPNMQILATGEYCRNQIIKIRPNAYGIQSHFELTPKMLAIWASEDSDLMLLDKDKLLQDFAAIQKVYAHTGETLLRNFIHLAGFGA
jgi:GMP synthase (glutamine-hydrolysing)